MRGQRVGRENAGAAAIGQDREPLAVLLAGQGQSLDRVEQLGHCRDPQHAGAAEGGVDTPRSLPASMPVCEAAARAPACERPAFSTSTGFSRAAARAADMNLRPCVMPSA